MTKRSLVKEEVRRTSNKTHLECGGKVHDLRNVFKPLVLASVWRDTQGLRVGVTPEILVQGFRKKVEILLLEPPVPFIHEIELGSVFE